MPTRTTQIEINASPSVAFDLIHDYSRRLDWDPFLRSAILLNGAVEAGHGVSSRCSAKLLAGGMSMDTEYVSFDRPNVAAVRLVRGPWCFKTFAATIRHTELSDNRSSVAYNVNFTAAPSWLRFLLTPIIERIFMRETKARLVALKDFIESSDNMES
jgi:ribosome-associated toxin RatA of RatAB toxin-antitoxin module